MIKALQGLQLSDYTRLVSLAYDRIQDFEALTEFITSVIPTLGRDLYSSDLLDPEIVEAWTAFRYRTITTIRRHLGKSGRQLFSSVDSWTET